MNLRPQCYYPQRSCHPPVENSSLIPAGSSKRDHSGTYSTVVISLQDSSIKKQKLVLSTCMLKINNVSFHKFNCYTTCLISHMYIFDYQFTLFYNPLLRITLRHGFWHHLGIASHQITTVYILQNIIFISVYFLKFIIELAYCHSKTTFPRKLYP